MKTDDKQDILDRTALQMLDTVVKAICRKTPDPHIRLDERFGKYRIQVEGEDQGRLIGTGGAGFWALNAIAFHAGGRALMVDEPKARWFGGKPVFKLNPNWDRERMKRVIGDILSSCCGITKWDTFETDPATVHYTISLPEECKDQWTQEETSLVEAIPIILSAAGKATGAQVKTAFQWE